MLCICWLSKWKCIALRGTCNVKICTHYLKNIITYKNFRSCALDYLSPFSLQKRKIFKVSDSLQTELVVSTSNVHCHSMTEYDWWWSLKLISWVWLWRSCRCLSTYTVALFPNPQLSLYLEEPLLLLLLPPPPLPLLLPLLVEFPCSTTFPQRVSAYSSLITWLELCQVGVIPCFVCPLGG